MVEAKKTMRTADLSAHIAAQLFSAINAEVEYYNPTGLGVNVIATDANPEDLVYPEGWYYAKGSFRNKHNTTTGAYEEIRLVKRSGEPW